MKFSERLTKFRIMALILSSLIPLFVIVLAITMLFSGTLITSAFLIAFIILPCTVLICNFFLIISKMKTFWKIVLYIPLLILFMIIFIGFSFLGEFRVLNSYKDENVAEHYSEVEDAFVLMPKLNEIAKPDTIEYYDYYLQSAVFFTSDTDVLICRYNEIDYSEQKALLDERYTFQQETIVMYGYSCEPIFEIDGYVFRGLSDKEYGYEIEYPKQFVMIATNDDNCEIVYMYFYDDDLDYIESMADFINTDCGWKYMR